MKKFDLIPYYDPYDLWATSFGQNVRKGFYKGHLKSKIMAVGIASCELFIPNLIRKFARTKKSLHPISVAQYILMACENSWISIGESLDYLALLREQAAIDDGESFSFGLGFTWVSKNGIYTSQEPFITHTPYAMEALLKLNSIDPSNLDSIKLFNKTWGFLESLIVMFNGNDKLALSYAPADEPRIVINANSYAALSYALHFINNHDCDKEVAYLKALNIVNWIIYNQRLDGGWMYYADNLPGNFIDCFHSCFVVKNLIKIRALLSLESSELNEAIDNGIDYIINNFYQKDVGLVKRFSVRDIKDPYKYILYDQAEFIGLLLDSGRVELAISTMDKVDDNFKIGNVYYSQIDIFGRRVGKEYMRWGVIPYLYQVSRLNSFRRSICVA
tara:strand:+ start:841 stop:2004 length:1164 start_codon:yes stop_codon:yes gene_type:complete